MSGSACWIVGVADAFLASGGLHFSGESKLSVCRAALDIFRRAGRHIQMGTPLDFREFDAVADPLIHGLRDAPAYHTSAVISMTERE
jgi:hypothetical protein